MAVTRDVMTAAQLYEAERATMLTAPESMLMDAAARAIARECAALVPTGPVVLLVGTGNNGGDALLAGALLAGSGADGPRPVTAVLVGPTAHARGLAALTEAGGLVIAGDSAEAPDAVARAALVVDGIVGLGGKAGLRPEAKRLVDAISPDARVVAVDMPSGLEADSPSADPPHVRADVTVTFTAPKRCLVEEPAAARAGRVVVADVGVSL